jgi:UV DNA damage repair endonuclease
LRNLAKKQVGHLSLERRKPVESKAHLMSFVERMAKTWSTPGLESITGSSRPHRTDDSAAAVE